MKRTYAVTICIVLVLATILPAPAQTDLGRRVTIDVTECTPQETFESLARSLDCTIKVDPAVKQPLTIRVVDMPASEVLGTICRSIKCEYRFDGKDIFIKPLSASRKRQLARMEEHSRALESRLPAGMHFNGAPLKDVLDAIARASGLQLRPWKDEGSREVSIDVGGKTVNEALKAIVCQIDGEGVVMMRTWAGSWGQYRLMDRRPKS